jgi:hypothetical protein
LGLRDSRADAQSAGQTGPKPSADAAWAYHVARIREVDLLEEGMIADVRRLCDQRRAAIQLEMQGDFVPELRLGTGAAAQRLGKSKAAILRRARKGAFGRNIMGRWTFTEDEIERVRGVR